MTILGIDILKKFVNMLTITVSTTWVFKELQEPKHKEFISSKKIQVM